MQITNFSLFFFSDTFFVGNIAVLYCCAVLYFCLQLKGKTRAEVHFLSFYINCCFSCGCGRVTVSTKLVQLLTHIFV